MDDYNSQNWLTELKKIPEYEILYNNLLEFTENKFEDHSISQIDIEYSKIVRIHPVLARIIEAQPLNTQYLYRVRRNVNLDTENIQLRSTFSYPQVQAAIGMDAQIFPKILSFIVLIMN